MPTAGKLGFRWSDAVALGEVHGGGLGAEVVESRPQLGNDRDRKHMVNVNVLAGVRAVLNCR